MRSRYSCDTARFHGRRYEPLVHIGLGHVVYGVLEGCGDGVRVRYQRPVVGDVGSTVVVDDHPVAGRVIEVDHSLERLVVDDHALDTVGGRVARGGHHDGDCIACEVGLANGHRQVSRVLHFVSDWPGTGQRSRPVALQVGTGVDRDHAVGGQCSRRVYGTDAGMGVRAADARDPQCTREIQVVYELRLPGQQGRVLLAESGRTNDAAGEWVHGVSHLGPLTRWRPGRP